MKTFTELVTFKNFDYVDDQVIKHYMIHRGFNETLNYYTFESLGIFKGCKNIVNYIIKNYNDKELHINASDIKELSNKFFDKINIYFNSNDVEGINGSYTAGYDNDEENEKYYMAFDIETNFTGTIQIACDSDNYVVDKSNDEVVRVTISDKK